MAKKRKKSKRNKQKRRQNEIRRAQESIRGGISYSQSEKLISETENTSSSEFDQKFASFKLPVKEIEKDLVKIILFAVFSVLVLVILKYSGFGFESFTRFFVS